MAAPTTSDLTLKIQSQIETVSQKLGIQQQSITDARNWGAEKLGHIRPWKTFFKSSALKRPKTVQEWKEKLQKNLAYFQSNYMVVFFVILLYVLITNLLLLISMVIIGMAYYAIFLRGQTRYLFFGVEVGRGQAYGMFIGLVFVLLYISSAGSALEWLLLLSCFVIFGHASLHSEIDIADEFV